jgi:oligopeptide transport system permease protein
MSTITAAAAVPVKKREGGSLWSDGWRRLKRNRLAVLSGWTLVAIGLVTLLAPWIPGLPDPNAADFALGVTGPSLAHPFGTDLLGRDMLARTIYGGRISILVGLVGTLVSLVIGVTYGALSAYAGGKVDEFLMRVVDVLYSLPYIFLVILLLTVFAKSLLLLFVALGAVQWLTMARIVRGQVLSLKNREFVVAARATGVSTRKIILRHLVPNTIGPVIVYATLTVPSVMLQEAFLSFLGLGVPPPYSSWGTLVNEGVGPMSIYPWQLVFPALMLAITLVSLNFLGDGLRDALDPQMRRE